MHMPTCPNGHTSADADYCDECGAAIGGAAASSGAATAVATEEPAAPATQTCPQCGATRTGRFCEVDGYDFVAADLRGDQPATGAGGAGGGAGSGTGDPAPGSDGAASPGPAPDATTGSGPDAAAPSAGEGPTGGAADGPGAGTNAPGADAPGADGAATNDADLTSAGPAGAGSGTDAGGTDSSSTSAPNAGAGSTDADGAGSGGAGSGGAKAGGPGAGGAAAGGGGTGDAATRTRWRLAVRADHDYHLRVLAMNGPDAEQMEFPKFAPERQFALQDDQVLVGRASRSRGIDPQIDLTGPPEDPGVSRSHAMLVRGADGWALVDLDSANGTYLNGSDEPIAANRPVPLRDGDRIHVGAWTTLQLIAG
ncbi:FHA domain-containing protein [Actinocatenispora sera]|uniref:FHA domain-containing protein n=1 Tax=Actinocatenispora sera TaxID=390989 RepID=UPI0033C8A609